MQDDIAKILFHTTTILARLDDIAQRITEDYRDKELTVVAVLNGSLMFMADLLRRIPLPLKLDCISVASYHGGTKTTGAVMFNQLSMPDINDRHVLDRKSTRLNSSHVSISYAVFCLKKKKKRPKAVER